MRPYRDSPAYAKLRDARRWHQHVKEQQHFLTPSAKRALRQSALDTAFSYAFLSRVWLDRRTSELPRLGDKIKRELKGLGARTVGEVENLNPATVASLLNVGPGTLGFLFDFLTAFGLEMSDDAPHVTEDTDTADYLRTKLADKLKLPPPVEQ